MTLGRPGAFRRRSCSATSTPSSRARPQRCPNDRGGEPFAPAELDAILDEVDVGLMPSVWEEAYGYAGVEFLAKGIPVIANAIGGMPDYVTRRRDRLAQPLVRRRRARADHGRRSIERPEQVAATSG